MKYNSIFFLLLLGFSIIPPTVSAQSLPTNQAQPIISFRGQDYLNTYDPNLHNGTWLSQPSWMLDYYDYKSNPVYVPYKINDTPNYLNFESFQTSITFDKNTCTVKIYNGGHIYSSSKPNINNVSFDLQNAVMNTDNWNESPINSLPCIIEYNPNPNGSTVDLIQGNDTTGTKDIQFIFDTTKNPEVKLSFTNNGQDSNHKYGFAMTLSNLKKIHLNKKDFLSNINSTNQPVIITSKEMTSDKISINGTSPIIFDTQKSKNHYLWASKIVKQGNQINLVLDYKNASRALNPNERLEIDPSWTSPAATNYAVETDNTRTDCLSLGSPSLNGNDQDIDTPQSGTTVFGCREFVSKFNTHSLPAAVTINTLKYNFTVSDVNVNSTKVCDFTAYTSDPNGQTAATIISSIAANTRYVSSSTACLSNGNKQVSLTAQAITDLTNNLKNDFFAIGNTYHDFNKSLGSDNDILLSNELLMVTYTWNPPSPITNLSCLDAGINIVNCSWSAPNSTDSIIGYYLSKNNTQAPLYSTSLLSDFRFDYNDPRWGIIDYGSALNNGTIQEGKTYAGNAAIIAQGMNFSNPQRVATPANNIYKFSNSQPFSVNFWLKPNNGGTSEFFNVGNSTGGSGFYARYLQGVILPCCRFVFGLHNDPNNSTGIETVSAVTMPYGNVWSMFTFVYNGNGTASGLSIYVNGTYQNVLSSTNSLSTRNANNLILNIGGRNTYDGLNHRYIGVNGVIDDFRIYTKALSQSEINTLLNYRILTSTIYTDNPAFYGNRYVYNVAGVSDKGQGYPSNSQTAFPYDIIDPPFKLNATLQNPSTNTFNDLIQFIPPKLKESLCPCPAIGYQIQELKNNVWTVISANQSSTTFLLSGNNLLNKIGQPIRVYTFNIAGTSPYDFPLDLPTYNEQLSHFMLHNNIFDSGTLQKSGSIVGTENYTSGRNGKAQVFDGATYDQLPNVSNFNFTKTQSFAIGAWIKTSSCANSATFISKMNSINSQGFALYCSNADGKARFTIHDGVTAYTISGVKVLTDNLWHNIFAYYNGNGNQNGMQIYEDGSLATTGSSSVINNQIQNNQKIRIGATNNANQFVGNIYDVRIFNGIMYPIQFSNIYNELTATTKNFTSSISINPVILGNAVLLKPRLYMTNGFPVTANLTQSNIYNYSTLLQQNNTNISTGNQVSMPTYFNYFSLINKSLIKVNATINAWNGTLKVNSPLQNITGNYIPIYKNVTGAQTPLWYFTAIRTNNGNLVNLKITAKPVTFNTTCTVQSTLTDSVKIAFTNQYLIDQNYTQFPARNTVYGICTDDPVTVVSFTLIGNGTGNAGVAVFDDVFGNNTFFGVPWIFIIVLLVAASITAKNTVIGSIVTVALVGILTATGYIDSSKFTSLIWGVIILLSAFCVFMGKKIFG